MSAFTTEQIDAEIALITTQLTENATALTSARKSLSYSIDTGQTRTSVQRQSIGQLQSERDTLYNRLSYWQGLKCGGAVRRINPAW